MLLVPKLWIPFWPAHRFLYYSIVRTCTGVFVSTFRICNIFTCRIQDFLFPREKYTSTFVPAEIPEYAQYRKVCPLLAGILGSTDHHPMCSILVTAGWLGIDTLLWVDLSLLLL